MSTARGYEAQLRLFMEYLTDPRYGWPATCQQRFGTAPQQLFHESNSVVHVSDYEGQPGSPPVELQRGAGAVRRRRRSGGINEAFEDARVAAGLPADLDLHCLRHSYVTHLLEFDYPERFVQDQVGHEYAATLAIYSGIGDEYRNRLLRRSLQRHPELWSDQP
jgi:integrase